MTPSLTPPPELYAKVRVIFILSVENIVFGPRGRRRRPGKITNDSRTGYGQIVPGTIRGTKRSEEIDVVDLIFVCV